MRLTFRRNPEQQVLLQPSVSSATSLLLLVAVPALVIGSLLQLLNFPMGVAVTQWLFIALPAAGYWRRFRVDRAVFARIRPLEKKYLPAILILACSTWIVLAIAQSLLIGALGSAGFEPVASFPFPETAGQFTAYLMAIALSAGICEEALFRGAIMPSLENEGLLPALLFSSLLFALMHMSLISLGGTFVLGLIIGLVVIKTGSLFAGMLYHFLNNLIALSAAYFAGQIELSGGATLLALLLGLLGLAYGLNLLQRRSPIQPLLSSRPRKILPGNWFNLASATIIIIFLLIGLLELLAGFGKIAPF